MSKKETRTVTVDPDVDEYLGQQEINASGLVNDLVKEYMSGADTDAVALRLQEKQKEREAEEAQQRLERVQTELAEIRELREEIEQQRDAVLEEALEQLSESPANPTNPAIKNWAAKMDMSPRQLCSELEQHQQQQ